VHPVSNHGFLVAARMTAPEPTSAPAASVRLQAQAARLARKGHPWFYRDDLLGSVPAHGALVRVLDDAGRDLGLGFTSAVSKLALRLCGPWPGASVPDREAFFGQRLTAAIARRQQWLGPRRGCRLVHGEADALPGLVVDSYGPVIVLQVSAPAVEHALDAIVPLLHAQLGAECVIARNDIAVRRLEDLPQEVQLLHGRRVMEVEIEEHGVVHTVRPFTGHKTGFYLDQRPARGQVQALARGRKVLDLFAYQGAFSLAALAGGATSALAVDQSAEALELAGAAAARQGLRGLTTRAANAFDLLRELREGEEKFDLVVLDPPAFAKSRRELAGAQRGYRDLNRIALRLLAPGGHLLTCSCSHHVTLPMFEELLRQAAAGLPFRTLLRQRLGAGPDHPAWLALPESEYLKVVLLQHGD
jgi:23S rRNA (cytosine1962-C5)-methyltransferase